MGFLTQANNTASPMIVSDQALTDLLLDSYMDQLFDVQHLSVSMDWKQFLTTDPEDLIYRREVLEEFRQLPELVQQVRAVTECIQEIQGSYQQHRGSQFYTENVREFELFHHAHDTLKALYDSLNKGIEDKTITAKGLLKLYEVVKEKLDLHFGATFQQDWAAMTSGLETIGSFSMQFALDDELHITDCAITGIRKEKYVKKLLNFGSKENQLPDKPWELSAVKEMRTPVEEALQDNLQADYRQFLQLMHDLTEDLQDLYQDLTFYLAGLGYWEQMESQYHQKLLFAEIRPMEEKAFNAAYMVDPVLLIHKGEAISNSIDFAAGGELLILTGMNQGGKTTFLRTIGTLQLLFQMGWPLTAASAEISPVEKIVTVFSHEENTQLQHGKLGQELKTMQLGMSELTPYSLMLFNEPITGTSPMENLYLSREILSVCKLNGYHGVWVTHIYDLAARCDEINAAVKGSLVSSLIVHVEGQGADVKTSYKVLRGAPSFTSYAKQVLEKTTGKLLG